MQFNGMSGEYTKVLLISANVGSIFEEPEQMFKLWLKEFLHTVEHLGPGLVALHCQEVGGKNYEASMQHVNQFVKTILASEELQKYDRARVFLDEDYTAADKFTALGNLYFIHENVEDVLIWDFVDSKFVPVEGREVLSGNIENITIKEKAKFPQHFFPEFKWSRKGFLRTRWNINNCIFDLVNIHLFHDASNIIAMQSSPSVYSGNRQQALMHTLRRFESDKYENVPMFVFGDFNFRLDTQLVIQELTAKTTSQQTRGKKDQVNKIVYTEEGNGKVVLTVETKGFDYHDRHSDLFSRTFKWLYQYDTELSSFREKLFEYDISFPPSYPFSEDVNNGMSYMKTRCPSWCDRILLTHCAKDIIVQEDKLWQPEYDLIGKDVCMGDHKPVYLCVHLKRGKGNLNEPQSPVKTPRKQVLSINGETLKNIDIASVNIHDYATFEKEQDLLPDFRASIRSRTDIENNALGTSSTGPVRRKKSFQEIAYKVIQMERVIDNWPRRQRSRHHSSSSEDFCEDEENNNAEKSNKDNENCGQEADTKSVTTTVSQISVEVNDTDKVTVLTPDLAETPSGGCDSANNNAILHDGPVAVTEHAPNTVSVSSPETGPTGSAKRPSLTKVAKKGSSTCCPCVLL